MSFGADPGVLFSVFGVLATGGEGAAVVGAAAGSESSSTTPATARMPTTRPTDTAPPRNETRERMAPE